MNDLAARLTAEAEERMAFSQTATPALCLEAADALELAEADRLIAQAEADQLRAALIQMRSDLDAMHEILDAYREDRDKAESERDAALAQVAWYKRATCAHGHLLIEHLPRWLSDEISTAKLGELCGYTVADLLPLRNALYAQRDAAVGKDGA